MIRRRSAGQPGNGVRQTITVHHGDPTAAAQVATVDFFHGLGLGGLDGMVRIGEKSARGRTFKGDLGPLQIWRGHGHSSASIRPGFNTALPATNGPAGHPNLALDLLGRIGPETK